MKVGERKGNTIYKGNGVYTGLATLKAKGNEPKKEFPFEFTWFDKAELAKSWKGSPEIFDELFKGALEQKVIAEARKARPGGAGASRPKSAIALLNEFARSKGCKHINELAKKHPQLMTEAVNYQLKIQAEQEKQA